MTTWSGGPPHDESPAVAALAGLAAAQAAVSAPPDPDENPEG